jgi:hypothetical protein
MPDCHLQRNGASIAEAKEVRFSDVEEFQQAGGVVRGLFEGERPIGKVCRMTIALLFKRDDLPVAGQRGEHLPKRRADCVATAV